MAGAKQPPLPGASQDWPTVGNTRQLGGLRSDAHSASPSMHTLVQAAPRATPAMQTLVSPEQ